MAERWWIADISVDFALFNFDVMLELLSRIIIGIINPSMIVGVVCVLKSVTVKKEFFELKMRILSASVLFIF